MTTLVVLNMYSIFIIKSLAISIGLSEFCKDNKEFIKKPSTLLRKSSENIKIQLDRRSTCFTRVTGRMKDYGKEENAFYF